MIETLTCLFSYLQVLYTTVYKFASVLRGNIRQILELPKTHFLVLQAQNKLKMIHMDTVFPIS